MILLALAIAAVPPTAIRTNDLNDICHTKTSTIRNVPLSAKRDVYKRANVPYGHRPKECSPKEISCYEVDHIVPLFAGGANTADRAKPGYLSNLQLQPYFGPCNAHHKDKVEVKLHSLICNGVLAPEEAHEKITNDWESLYKQYINPKGCR